MNKITHLSNSLTETQKIAREFAKILKGGEVVALYGELGTGKTVFVQAVAKQLGIKSRIKSPTFVLVRNYPLPNKKNINLFHLDLYRLNSISDLKSIDINEIIEDRNNITFIEWAEKAKNYLPQKRINIYIVYKGKNQREITIEDNIK